MTATAAQTQTAIEDAARAAGFEIRPDSVQYVSADRREDGVVVAHLGVQITTRGVVYAGSGAVGGYAAGSREAFTQFEGPGKLAQVMAWIAANAAPTATTPSEETAPVSYLTHSDAMTRPHDHEAPAGC